MCLSLRHLVSLLLSLLLHGRFHSVSACIAVLIPARGILRVVSHRIILWILADAGLRFVCSSVASLDATTELDGAEHLANPPDGREQGQAAEDDGEKHKGGPPETGHHDPPSRRQSSKPMIGPTCSSAAPRNDSEKTNRGGKELLYHFKTANEPCGVSPPKLSTFKPTRDSPPLKSAAVPSKTSGAKPRFSPPHHELDVSSGASCHGIHTGDTKRSNMSQHLEAGGMHAETPGHPVTDTSLGKENVTNGSKRLELVAKTEVEQVLKDANQHLSGSVSRGMRAKIQKANERKMQMRMQNIQKKQALRVSLDSCVRNKQGTVAAENWPRFAADVFFPPPLSPPQRVVRTSVAQGPHVDEPEVVSLRSEPLVRFEDPVCMTVDDADVVMEDLSGATLVEEDVAVLDVEMEDLAYRFSLLWGRVIR